jgi:NAD(P)-dependent dehydrogenase (short-subunit alcohol dehydrogenase family)
MTNNKYALITGGSSGLGFAIAKRLVKEGFTPILIARGKERLDTAVDVLSKMGTGAYGFKGDITCPSDLTVIADFIKDKFGSLDFLVLNAGVVSVSLLADYNNFHKMKEDIEIDLWGTVLAARVFMPLLKQQSRILMISSGFGLIGAAAYSTYCAAKAGIVNFAEALRRELLCKKISLYVACPADIDTPQYEQERKDMPDWMVRATPGRHNLLSPDTAAEKILKKCTGKKLIITINFEISLLRFLKRLLPERIMTIILDFSLPRPK